MHIGIKSLERNIGIERAILYGLLFFCPMSFSCHKEKPGSVLPLATQTGANTVGFILDDLVWTPFQKCGLSRDPCGTIRGGVSPGLIDFQFGRDQGNSTSLTISSNNRGTVSSAGEKIDSVLVTYTGGSSALIYFGPLPGSSFKVTKYDVLNEIISGEFHFILYNNNQPGKTITLKDGRFDFKFNACKCN